MTEPREYTRLPGTVETSSFRKTSEDFTFTIATPRKYEEQAKAMMGRLASFGVFVFTPCSTGEADAFLKNGDAAAPRLGKAAPEVVAVAPISLHDLSVLCEVDERTIQLWAEKSLVIRHSPGFYDRDETIRALNKARKDAETATGDALRDVKLMREKERLLKDQIANRERAGKLVSTEAIRRGIEAVEAEDRNDVLNMPKSLGPECDMISGTEAEVKLNRWVRDFLSKGSKYERVRQVAGNAIAAAPAEPRRPEPTKKKKKKKR